MPTSYGVTVDDLSFQCDRVFDECTQEYRRKALSAFSA